MSTVTTQIEHLTPLTGAPAGEHDARIQIEHPPYSQLRHPLIAGNKSNADVTRDICHLLDPKARPRLVDQLIHLTGVAGHWRGGNRVYGNHRNRHVGIE